MFLILFGISIVKTAFKKIKNIFKKYFLLTYKLRKLEYQQELDILLVQAVNDDLLYSIF